MSVPQTSKRSHSPTFLSPNGSYKSKRVAYYILEKDDSVSSDDTESVLSCQDKVTDEAHDTTDITTDSSIYDDFDSDDSDSLEYNILTSSDENIDLEYFDSSDVEDFEPIPPIMIKKYSTEEECITDSEPSSSSYEPISENDDNKNKPKIIFEKCLQCHLKNTNRRYQYCWKCFDKRKNLFPLRKSNLRHKSLILSPTSATTSSGYQSSNQSDCKLSSSSSLLSISSDVQNSLINEPCIICLSNAKNCAFVHGRIGHLSTCYICAQKVWATTKRCPICNNKASNIVKVFLH